MNAFDLDPSKRWLFCLTHPDDEISICAWIKRLVQNGNPVYLSWTHSNPVRETEARAVAFLLGIPAHHLFFFGATDGHVCDEIHDLMPRFRQMMEQVRPDRVVCGAFEQGHIDHDTTNFLVNQTFSGPVLEVPFYHTYLTRLQRLNRFSSPVGEQVLELTRQEQKLKKMVARQYPSQNIWRVLFWYEIYQSAKLQPAILMRTERMRFQTHRNFLEPNHPPRLAAKVKKCSIWQRWASSVIAAEARLIVGDREPLSDRATASVDR